MASNSSDTLRWPSEDFKQALAHLNKLALDYSYTDSLYPLFCAPVVEEEQRWLDEALQKTHPKQSHIEYGFFESQEIQAHAIESKDQKAFIAVGAHCAVLIGSFFRNAFARQELFTSLGAASNEAVTTRVTPSIVEIDLLIIPKDPQRATAAQICTFMAMRFLTSHELTHIVNGHLRINNYGHFDYASMSEKVVDLSLANALRQQTLEMDADCGALVHSMNLVMSGKLTLLVDGNQHPFLSNPEIAIHTWLFTIYCLFRILQGDKQTRNVLQLSHPPPASRLWMLVITLEKYLRERGWKKEASRIAVIVASVITEGEKACCGTISQTPLSGNLEVLTRTYTGFLAREWVHLRPMLEKVATSGGKLAPALPGLLKWPYKYPIERSSTRSR